MGRNEFEEKFQVMQMKKAIDARNGRKVKLRWNSATAVRRSLAAINNMVANHELTAKEANAIYFSANLILKALEMEMETHPHRKRSEKIQEC